MAKIVKSRWLDRALFFNSGCYTLCTNEKQFKRVLSEFKIPRRERPDFVANWHSDATSHFLENRDEGKVAVVVCVRSFEGKTRAQIAGLLTHEAVHIWQQTRENTGEREPSSELEAYAIQNIMQNLLEEFERQTGEA